MFAAACRRCSSEKIGPSRGTYCEVGIPWSSTGLGLAAGAKTAGSATMATQGMGGVGKTTAAAQLIRDPDIGACFERLLWVPVSAEPDILALLRVLASRPPAGRLPAGWLP